MMHPLCVKGELIIELTMHAGIKFSFLTLH